MSTLDPQKLHVSFDDSLAEQIALIPRCYTLTHSDITGDLFLKIARKYDMEAISGWYTKLMRDEVLGEWQEEGRPSLHIHCHVNGGPVFGPAKWRDSIFRQHVPMALQAICSGDKPFITGKIRLHTAPVMVHFHAKQEALNRIEEWGKVKDYIVTEG